VTTVPPNSQTSGPGPANIRTGGELLAAKLDQLNMKADPDRRYTPVNDLGLG